MSGSIGNVWVTMGMMFASLSGSNGSLGQLWLFAAGDVAGCLLAVLILRTLKK